MLYKCTYCILLCMAVSKLCNICLQMTSECTLLLSLAAQCLYFFQNIYKTRIIHKWCKYSIHSTKETFKHLLSHHLNRNLLCHKVVHKQLLSVMPTKLSMLVTHPAHKKLEHNCSNIQNGKKNIFCFCAIFLLIMIRILLPCRHKSLLLI